MTLGTLYLRNYATIVYYGHAGFIVSTVEIRVFGLELQRVQGLGLRV